MIIEGHFLLYFSFLKFESFLRTFWASFLHLKQKEYGTLKTAKTPGITGVFTVFAFSSDNLGGEGEIRTLEPR